MEGDFISSRICVMILFLFTLYVPYAKRQRQQLVSTLYMLVDSTIHPRNNHIPPTLRKNIPSSSVGPAHLDVYIKTLKETTNDYLLISFVVGTSGFNGCNNFKCLIFV